MKKVLIVLVAVVLTASVFAQTTQKSKNQPVILNSSDQLNAISYKVGDFAHGGIVFWVDATKQHGLVCAKTDQITQVRWSAGTFTYTMALGDGPLAGKMNTAIIIANQGRGDGNTYAARICNELQVTAGSKTYGDWYLPSREELNLMYQNKATIDATANLKQGSAFASAYYWSSTENTDNGAWLHDFTNGGSLSMSKNLTTVRVRAVRSF